MQDQNQFSYKYIGPNHNFHKSGKAFYIYSQVFIATFYLLHFEYISKMCVKVDTSDQITMFFTHAI